MSSLHPAWVWIMAPLNSINLGDEIVSHTESSHLGLWKYPSVYLSPSIFFFHRGINFFEIKHGYSVFVAIRTYFYISWTIISDIKEKCYWVFVSIFLSRQIFESNLSKYFNHVPSLFLHLLHNILCRFFCTPSRTWEIILYSGVFLLNSWMDSEF